MYVEVSPDEASSSNSMDSLGEPNSSLKHSCVYYSIGRDDNNIFL